MFWFMTSTEESEKWFGSQCIHGNSLDIETSTIALKGCIDYIDKGELQMWWHLLLMCLL